MLRLKEDVEDWVETKWDCLKKARWKIFSAFLGLCLVSLLLYGVVVYFFHCNSCELSDYAEYGSYGSQINGQHNGEHMYLLKRRLHIHFV